MARDPHASTLTNLQPLLLLLLDAFLLPSFCSPIQVLVAAYAASRGLDMHNLPYVVSYDERPAHLHAHNFCAAAATAAGCPPATSFLTFSTMHLYGQRPAHVHAHKGTAAGCVPAVLSFLMVRFW